MHLPSPYTLSPFFHPLKFILPLSSICTPPYRTLFLSSRSILSNQNPRHFRRSIPPHQRNQPYSNPLSLPNLLHKRPTLLPSPTSHSPYNTSSSPLHTIHTYPILPTHTNPHSPPSLNSSPPKHLSTHSILQIRPLKPKPLDLLPSILSHQHTQLPPTNLA